MLQANSMCIYHDQNQYYINTKEMEARDSTGLKPNIGCAVCK